MSDPVTPILGTIAAVTSLLKATRTISDWINDYRHAPEFVVDLQVYILGFVVFIEGVQNALSNPTIAGRIPPEQTNLVIGKAREILEQLRDALKQVLRDTGSEINRAKWVQYQGKCREVQQRLAWYRESLNGIIHTAQS
jgi:hypothetical protein